MSEDAGIHIQQNGDWSILRPVGRLGLSEVDEFKEMLHSVTARDKPMLVVDFERVTFINSSSLGLLLEARSETQKKNGRMALACLPVEVNRVFEISHLDQLFRIVDSVDQAMQ